jgi:vesicular inhibitory amino acid transporter
MMLCGIFLIPCAFLKNLHHVSTLSFWCTVAHFLINLIVVAYCLACIGQWGWGQVSFSLDMDTFPISLGIIVFSYTSHIFLPTLEGNMLEPEKFGRMLDWSHYAAAAFKSGFGYLGFLTWQKSTMQVEYADNL